MWTDIVCLLRYRNNLRSLVVRFLKMRWRMMRRKKKMAMAMRSKKNRLDKSWLPAVYKMLVNEACGIHEYIAHIRSYKPNTLCLEA